MHTARGHHGAHPGICTSLTVEDGTVLDAPAGPESVISEKRLNYARV